MQFRMVPHQAKKRKHESNTSDVLRTGEGQTATRGREPLSCLRRLHACGEELDEFGAVGEEGVKSRRGVDKFAVAQELKPVFGLSRFLERDLEFRREVRLTLRVSAFGDVRANGRAGSQHLLCDDGFLSLAQVFVQAHGAQGKGFGLCEQNAVFHVVRLSACRFRL